MDHFTRLDNPYLDRWFQTNQEHRIHARRWRELSIKCNRLDDKLKGGANPEKRGAGGISKNAESASGIGKAVQSKSRQRIYRCDQLDRWPDYAYASNHHRWGKWGGWRGEVCGGWSSSLIVKERDQPEHWWWGWRRSKFAWLGRGAQWPLKLGQGVIVWKRRRDRGAECPTIERPSRCLAAGCRKGVGALAASRPSKTCLITDADWPNESKPGHDLQRISPCIYETTQGQLSLRFKTEEAT